jgi:branched-chain amino acid transport system ATP-binding protein
MHRSAEEGLLRVERLVKHFHGIAAIAGLTLTLHHSESLGLAGGNGSGKTTLIDIITGFARPERGRVWLGAQDVTGWPAHRMVRAGIGRTFQTPRIAPRLTVEQHLQAAVLHRSLARPSELREAARTLELMNLGGVRRHETRALSAAQLRRLEIARALVAGTRVLLLDEPFAALGPDDLPSMISALRRLRAEGLTMLVAARSDRLLRALCDRIAVMEAGTVSRIPQTTGWPHA